MRLRIILALGLLWQISAAASPIDIRIVPDGFDSKEEDILAVLTSTTRELSKHFPDYEIEPVVILRGSDGPITLYQRNIRGEIVVRLDTQKTYWSQYSYQWAHELCHILAGFRDDSRENKWFEESLCEVASLYALRRMSESWEKDPPFPHWKSYRQSLKKYVDQVMATRADIALEDLPSFYQKHWTNLREKSNDRNLNGTFAKTLLPLFEKDPSRWEAIRYLNVTPARKALSLRAYFSKWHHDAPERHRPFIRELGVLFGLDR